MGDFRFLGTYVYYKIYSSSSTMISNHNSIEAVNNSTDYSAAAGRMLNYGYQELRTDGVFLSPLVEKKKYENVRVRIRLTNYGKEPNIDDYKAQIVIDGTDVRIPRRSLGEIYSFDFGRYNKTSDYPTTNISYNHPASSDEDFSGNAPSDNKYYVDMYAVAAGRDRNFATYYSNVTYLGSITIDANNENN